MPFQSITKACALCGTHFIIDASRFRKKIYCSTSCYHAAPLKPFAERFWKRVDRSGGPDACWPWLSMKMTGGYGVAGLDHKRQAAHRIAFELEYGHIDPKLLVLHQCDVRYQPGDITYRACCNPAHLMQGTHKDNSRQMVERGRAATGERSSAKLHPESVPRGELHPCAKLTEESVRFIRDNHANGITRLDFYAERFGVRKMAISDVILRKTWKHV